MSKHLPPLPPENRAKHGPARPHGSTGDETDGKSPSQDKKNLKEQGQQGNTWQNTHHQGHQQDR